VAVGESGPRWMREGAGQHIDAVCGRRIIGLMSARSDSSAARLHALHIGVLGLWLGSLAAVGATAAVAFPAMKALGPALPGFRVPQDDHWSIAAGHIMNPMFFAVMIAGICFGLLSLGAWRSLGAARRVLCVLSLLLAVGTLTGLGLPMRAHLDEYWAAARAGDLERAESAKPRFDALHPWSSGALTTQAGLVGALLVAGVIRAGRGLAAGAAA